MAEERSAVHTGVNERPKAEVFSKSGDPIPPPISSQDSINLPLIKARLRSAKPQVPTSRHFPS